jgi:hypothetical protein
MSWAGAILFSGLAATADAQSAPPREPVAHADNYWRRFAVGFATSLVAHETAHFLASYALGAHPYVGFDHGRPTVYSGINSDTDPHKQFIFSAAGLTTQTLINEAILDLPRSRGGAIERGILAGGIGTTLFYITLGRNASVSDISLMARTSSLSKTELSLIFGVVSAVQAWRISRQGAYSHFLLRPGPSGATLQFSY